MKITIDDIRSQLITGKRIADIPLRVTSYGRVSTSKDAQINSLKHQKTYFEQEIQRNPVWEFVEGYYDEGISGTSTLKRHEFNRMILDAKAGMFDVILTKDVYRFARDLLDSIAYTRELLKYNVAVIFIDIGLNTAEPDAEMRLSIMASMAQEDSRRLSEKVKFGYGVTQQQGKRHGATAPIGYDFDDAINGYSINPDTSRIVDYVFKRYAQNEVGTRIISRELYNMGYRNKSGNAFYPSTIKRMIESPVYKGYIVNKKSQKTSYRDRSSKYFSADEWILHYDPVRVPPIIDDDLWEQANRVLRARGEFMSDVDCSAFDNNKGGKYTYSTRIYCEEHECNYQRATQRWFVDGEKRVAEYWRCARYKRIEKEMKCNAPILYKRDLDEIMRTFFAKFTKNAYEFDEMKSAFKAMQTGNNYSKEITMTKAQIEETQKRKSKLLYGWMDGVIDNKAYTAANAELEDHLKELQEKLAWSETMQQGSDKIEKQIDAFEQTLTSKVLDIGSETILEELVRCFVKRINVRENTEKHGEFTLDIVLHAQPDRAAFQYALCAPKARCRDTKYIILDEQRFRLAPSKIQPKYSKDCAIRLLFSPIT